MDSLVDDLHTLISNLLTNYEATYFNYKPTTNHIYNGYYELRCYKKVVYFMAKDRLFHDPRFQTALHSRVDGSNYLLLGLAAGGHIDMIEEMLQHERKYILSDIYSLACCEAEFYGHTNIVNLLKPRCRDLVNYNTILRLDDAVYNKLTVDYWRRGMVESLDGNQENIVTMVSMLFHVNPCKYKLFANYIDGVSKLGLEKDNPYLDALKWAIKECEFKIIFKIVENSYKFPGIYRAIISKIRASTKFAILCFDRCHRYMSTMEVISILQKYPHPDFYDPQQDISDYVIKTYKRYDLYYLSLIHKERTQYHGKRDDVMIEMGHQLVLQQLNCNRIIVFTIVFLVMTFIIFLLVNVT